MRKYRVFPYYCRYNNEPRFEVQYHDEQHGCWLYVGDEDVFARFDTAMKAEYYIKGLINAERDRRIRENMFKIKGDIFEKQNPPYIYPKETE